MTKRIASILVLLVVFGVTVALAAPPPPVTGKVVAIEGNEVQIALEGEIPSWVKKNAPLKFADGVGKILAVSEEGVTPVVITVRTKLASKMAVDQPVSFEKGKAMAGC